MSVTTIPEGFRVTVVSYEGDADNYKTVVLEGLSDAEVRGVVTLCKLHYSRNDHRRKGWGNIYDPSFDEIEKYGEVLNGLDDNYPVPKGYGDFNELAFKLCLQGDDFFTRAFESIKIEYVPTEIKLEDVTGSFI